MTLRITLITAPDIYQNDNHSLLLINPSVQEQDMSSSWLGQSTLDIPLNLYYYSNENNIDWLLFALASADYVYVNIDNCKDQSASLIGYIIGKSKCFYSSNNDSILDTYKKINHNYVNNINDFLESILSEKQ